MKLKPPDILPYVATSAIGALAMAARGSTPDDSQDGEDSGASKAGS